jgi:hypothetical protein
MIDASATTVSLVEEYMALADTVSACESRRREILEELKKRETLSVVASNLSNLTSNQVDALKLHLGITKSELVASKVDVK